MALPLQCKPCCLPHSQAYNRGCTKVFCSRIPLLIEKVSRFPINDSLTHWNNNLGVARKCMQVVTKRNFDNSFGGITSSSVLKYPLDFKHGLSSLGSTILWRFFRTRIHKHAAASNVHLLDEFDQQTRESADQSNGISPTLWREDPDGTANWSQGTGYFQLTSNIIDRVKELDSFMEQLEDLHMKVGSMITEGDEDTAMELVEANYEALMEQVDEGIEGVEQAAMLDILIDLSLSLHDVEAPEQMLNQMKNILSKVEMSEPFVDILYEHMGRAYLALNNKEESLSCYTRSLEIQESFVGENSPLLVSTLFGLAAAYNDFGERTKGKGMYERIVSLIESSAGTASENLVEPFLHLGHILLEEKKADEAEVYMQRALKIAKVAKGGGQVGIASCALARVKCAKGEYDKAAELFQKGLTILRKSSFLSSQDPVMENIRTEFAEFLARVGRNEEAQELFKENLLEKEKRVGANSPRLVVHLQNLSTAYAQDGKFEKCEPLLRRSLKLVTTCLGPTSPQVSIPLEFLATALHHLGKNIEAESLARQTLSIRENNFPMDNPLVGEACNILASILHSNGKNEEAVTLAWRALHIKEKHAGKNNRELGGILDLLIDLLHSLGRTKETLPLIERLERIIATPSKSPA